MKDLLFSLSLIMTFLFADAQDLHVKTFGSSKNEPVIFIHGGPGSSASAFGITTAQRLSDSGFYVILYDRRGEGLSADEHALYTFKQTFEDLNHIYAKLGITKATLIGFSFGGIISTLYTEKYPAHVKSLILVSSLLSQPETYHTILRKSKAIYMAQNDTVKLNDILNIEKMNEGSFEYRAACFRHSSGNGFFSTKNKNELAKKLYAGLESDSAYAKLSAHKSNASVIGFWKNEHYSNLSILPVLKQLKSEKMKIYALYGKDDGLFSSRQVVNLSQIVGKDKLKYLENCSHYLYTDQQDIFVSQLAMWLK